MDDKKSKTLYRINSKLEDERNDVINLLEYGNDINIDDFIINFYRTRMKNKEYILEESIEFFKEMVDNEARRVITKEEELKKIMKEKK